MTQRESILNMLSGGDWVCGTVFMENYIPDGVSFVLFDVKVNEWYLKREDVEDVASKFGIKIVPIVGHGTLQDAIDMIKKGMKSEWGNFIAEGIVARPRVEVFTRKGERVIAKIKYKDYNFPPQEIDV